MEFKYQVAISFASENQVLAEKVYHYLKAENIVAFFSPMPECQALISGLNQREAFYRIFGIESEYAVLLISQHYLLKCVPMEEASIAFSKRGSEGKVIPIYLDNAALPTELLNPQQVNYFRSNNPAAIASHIAAKINNGLKQPPKSSHNSSGKNVMNISNNTAGTQIFINHLEDGMQK